MEVVSNERVGGNLVSGENGYFDPELIYLDYGRSYTLTETKSPNGYIGLPQSLTINMPEEPAQGGEEGNVTVSAAADISGYYELTQKTATAPTTLTIRNRPFELNVLKADPNTEAEPVPLAGAKFKLYKYSLVNGVSLPLVVEGWNEVSTNASGYFNNNLPTEPGDYALEELEPPGGYKPLGANNWIRFSISPTGIIGQPASEAGATLTGPVEVTGDTTGLVAYTITIPNEPLPLYLRKVDASGEDLTGAKFKLLRLRPATPENQTDHQIWQAVEGYSDIDMTSISKIALTSLPKGVYCLTETLAPKGYVIFESKTYFRISDGRSVALTDENGTGENSNPSARIDQGVDDNKNSVYIITVKNTPGASLPNAGGPGTNLIYLFGIMLTGLAGTGLVMKRRRRNVA